MNTLKIILIIISLIILIGLFGVYLFATSGQTNLSLKPQKSNQNNNFTFGGNMSNNNSSTNMQFYNNLRYQDKNISYKISDKCTLQKKDDARRAFERIQNKTILTFYEVRDNEEILVNCDSKVKVKGDFFIAGEGGPVNITKSGEFNVISKGEILLIRQSECPNPNVATHELFHALGFKHSANPNNIMYPTTQCSQTIGEDMPNLINKLYSIPSYPDLIIEDASPLINGRQLNVNMSIINNGLRESKESSLEVYVDDKLLKTVDVGLLNVGGGAKLVLQNIYITKANFNELKFIIKTDSEEINKENNEVIFEEQK